VVKLQMMSVGAMGLPPESLSGAGMDEKKPFTGRAWLDWRSKLRPAINIGSCEAEAPMPPHLSRRQQWPSHHLMFSQRNQISRRIHNSAAHESQTPQASMKSSPPSLLPSVFTTATPSGVNR